MARQKVKVGVSTYKFSFKLIINKAIETQLSFFFAYNIIFLFIYFY